MASEVSENMDNHINNLDKFEKYSALTKINNKYYVFSTEDGKPIVSPSIETLASLLIDTKIESRIISTNNMELIARYTTGAVKKLKDTKPFEYVIECNHRYFEEKYNSGLSIQNMRRRIHIKDLAEKIINILSREYRKKE